MKNLDSVLKSQRRYSADKGLYSQGYGLPSGHVWLWDLDREEGRTPKILYLRNVVLEKTPESSLNSKEIKPANLNIDQPWIFTRRTDAEAEAPVFWSSDVNRWLIGKLGRVESRRRGHQRMRWLDGIIQCKEHELEQTLVDGEGHGSLVCCSPWGHKELDMTELLNNNVNSMCVCVCMKEKESEVTQLCPTLCDPMDCSLPGSSVHGILQARVLEWVAISFSRGSSWPRN